MFAEVVTGLFGGAGILLASVATRSAIRQSIGHIWFDLSIPVVPFFVSIIFAMYVGMDFLLAIVVVFAEVVLFLIIDYLLIRIDPDPGNEYWQE